MGHTINYILLTEKNWHNSLFDNLQKRTGENWVRIESKEYLTFEHLQTIKPVKIFIPHWSYIIPAEIYNQFECVVFHMTDLPFGRGGSPLQNLIVRGLSETKISAIKVDEGIDTGFVYLKEPLALDGTAQEIFERAVPIIQKMIESIIHKNIVPKPQTGKPLIFKRRQPSEGNISDLEDLLKVYDYIRMLDCEGYPNAFIETGKLRVEFSKAEIDNEQNFVTANVRISKK